MKHITLTAYDQMNCTASYFIRKLWVRIAKWFLLAIAVSALALSANAEEHNLCNVNADKNFFKVNCRHATLQQLQTAFKKSGQVEFQFPYELTNAPVSVVVDRVLLESLLQTALSSYNYIVSDNDNSTSGTAKVTVVGLRDATTGKVSSSTPAPAFESLLQPETPGPTPSPIPEKNGVEAIDAGSVITAGPTPGPGVKVIVNHPQSVPASNTGATQPNGGGEVSTTIPHLTSAPLESSHVFDGAKEPNMMLDLAPSVPSTQ